MAGIYPIEETRFYIPAAAGAILAHCVYKHGWRPLPWVYVWGQMTFGFAVMGMHTFYFNYARAFYHDWDNLFLGRPFSLPHLETEGVGLSPGAIFNYFVGSNEPLNTRGQLG